MRHAYPAQPELNILPIEQIRLPLTSRDELPPILAALQWVWSHPTLKTELFALLEAKVLAGKQATGRTGMTRWQILVLGVVRLGLAADWDRMEYLARYDLLLRQMLGLPATPWGQDAKGFGHQTLRDNVALLDDAVLKEINARVAAAGRAVFATTPGAPPAPLAIKVDTYVLETDVHFPTDLNLLWDAGRKCVDLILKYRDQFGHDLPGWRKGKDWRRRSERVWLDFPNGSLPPGLTFSYGTVTSSNQQFVISGTPTNTGTFAFTMGAYDASGFQVSRSFSITISASTLQITTTSLTNALVGAAAKHLAPVRAGAGRGREDRIMENRRLKLKDGSELDLRRAYATPRDEDGVGGGPVDAEIGLLRLGRACAINGVGGFTFTVLVVRVADAAGVVTDHLRLPVRTAGTAGRAWLSSARRRELHHARGARGTDAPYRG